MEVTMDRPKLGADIECAIPLIINTTSFACTWPSNMYGKSAPI